MRRGFGAVRVTTAASLATDSATDRTTVEIFRTNGQSTAAAREATSRALIIAVSPCGKPGLDFCLFLFWFSFFLIFRFCAVRSIS